MQIDGGRVDKDLANPADNKGALSFGYFDTTNMPEGKLAQQYTIAGNFHQSSFGGSFPIICTPRAPKFYAGGLNNALADTADRNF